jgi:hypothetical protein
MEKIIAMCGLVCSDCPAYLATQSGDAAALQRVAETWSQEYGTALTADDCACNGCGALEGPWMSHCAECDIRACGMEQEIVTCAQCTSYACDKLRKFFEFVPAAEATLDGLRESG